MISPPWTEIGRCQSDIRSIESTLSRKADSHELYSLRSNVDSLARAVRELRSEIDGLRYELLTLQQVSEERTQSEVNR